MRIRQTSFITRKVIFWAFLPIWVSWPLSGSKMMYSWSLFIYTSNEMPLPSMPSMRGWWRDVSGGRKVRPPPFAWFHERTVKRSRKFFQLKHILILPQEHINNWKGATCLGLNQSQLLKSTLPTKCMRRDYLKLAYSGANIQTSRELLKACSEAMN